MREPLGVVGSVAVPVLLFVVVGRIAAGSVETPEVEMTTDGPGTTAFLQADLPVFAAILIALSAVLSLVTIIAIYRDGGILCRLRATPVRPPTILLAHVLVKFMFTAATLALMVLAGRRFYSGGRRRTARLLHPSPSSSPPGACSRSASSRRWSRWRACSR